MAEKLTGTPISGGDQLSPAGYTKESAFDGITTTTWLCEQRGANANNTAYIGLLFEGSVSILSIRILTWGTTRTPRTLSLRGSNDGVAWDRIATFTDIIHSTAYRTLDGFAQASGYKYVSLWCDLVSATVDPANAGFAINEVEFYGKHDDYIPVSLAPINTAILMSTLPASLSRGFR